MRIPIGSGGAGDLGAWSAVAALTVLGMGCGSNGMAGLIGPIERDGQYVLESSGLTFAVDPNGARVTDVHLAGGTNLLTGSSVDAIDYGSTFWTSPQSEWNWPPPAAFDTDPYLASVDAPSLSFVGSTSPEVNASISKRFTANVEKSQILATYTITADDAGEMFAPWEITRVFPGGLTFFPTGASAPTAGGGFALPPTADAAGCTWYQHPGVAPGTNQKLLADGSGGWLAQVAGNVVLVKKFADVPDGMAAPGEAEIEIFVQDQGQYVEIEQQGAYQPLGQGETLTWPVVWIVRALPDGMSATVGNSDLVKFVQSLVGG